MGKITVYSAKGKCYALKSADGTEEVLTSWDDAKKFISSHKNTQYKSFATEEMARAWLRGERPTIAELPAGETVYTDGSFSSENKSYGWGFVHVSDADLKNDGRVMDFRCGKGTDDLVIDERNVAGEMVAAMSTVQYMIVRRIHTFTIRYDYAGIGKWVTGEFKTSSEGSVKYKDWMNKMIQKYNLDITFEQIPGHTGDWYNEFVDILARKGCGAKVKPAETAIIEDVEKNECAGRLYD